jgi:hypothetical protein
MPRYRDRSGEARYHASRRKREERGGACVLAHGVDNASEMAPEARHQPDRSCADERRSPLLFDAAISRISAGTFSFGSIRTGSQVPAVHQQRTRQRNRHSVFDDLSWFSAVDSSATPEMFPTGNVQEIRGSGCESR